MPRAPPPSEMLTVPPRGETEPTEPNSTTPRQQPHRAMWRGRARARRNPAEARVESPHPLPTTLAIAVMVRTSTFDRGPTAIATGPEMGEWRGSDRRLKPGSPPLSQHADPAVLVEIEPTGLIGTTPRQHLGGGSWPYLVHARRPARRHSVITIRTTMAAPMATSQGQTDSRPWAATRSMTR